MGFTILDGFWFGLGALLAIGAIVLFLIVVTLITAFISYLIDRRSKRKER